MPENKRHLSIEAAHQAQVSLGKLYDQLGDTKHPSGVILIAYRNARRALDSVFRRTTGFALAYAIHEIMMELRGNIEYTGRKMLAKAAHIGKIQAGVDYKVWNLPKHDTSPVGYTAAMLASWLGVIDQQIRDINSTLWLTGNRDLVLGDGSRIGLARPDSVIRAGTRVLTTAAIIAYYQDMAGIKSTLFKWGKQALPAIDIHTTDCCLRVAGQVVLIDDEFKLVGTPRFADKIGWPPFHWHCRTTTGLVPMHLADDDLTRAIKDSAKTFLAKRKK